jgi:hypothetical protein
VYLSSNSTVFLHREPVCPAYGWIDRSACSVLCQHSATAFHGAAGLVHRAVGQAENFALSRRVVVFPESPTLSGTAHKMSGTVEIWGDRSNNDMTDPAVSGPDGLSMGRVLQLAETGPDAVAEGIDLMEPHRSSGLADIANLGLTLSEANE